MKPSIGLMASIAAGWHHGELGMKKIRLRPTAIVTAVKFGMGGFVYEAGVVIRPDKLFLYFNQEHCSTEDG